MTPCVVRKLAVRSRLQSNCFRFDEELWHSWVTEHIGGAYRQVMRCDNGVADFPLMGEQCAPVWYDFLEATVDVVQVMLEPAAPAPLRWRRHDFGCRYAFLSVGSRCRGGCKSLSA